MGPSKGVQVSLGVGTIGQQTSFGHAGMGGVLPPSDVAVRGQSHGSLWALGVLRSVGWGCWVPPKGVQVPLGVGTVGRRTSFGRAASYLAWVLCLVWASFGRLEVSFGCHWVPLGAMGQSLGVGGCGWWLWPGVLAS